MRKKVYNIGINDADYFVTHCPYYQLWKHLLERCFSPIYHKRYPTARKFTISKDWLVFSNFKQWMEQQNWKGRFINKNMIYKDCNHYSSETCIFIPGELSPLLYHPRQSIRKNNLPTGVYLNKRNTYDAKVTMNSETIYIGSFKTIKEAQEAYTFVKAEYIKEIISKLDSSETELKQILYNYCSNYLEIENEK